MPNIQIKGVPSDTHAVLRARAAEHHQSMQEYLLSLLIAQTSRPTLDEVLARASNRRGGSVPAAASVEILTRERAGH